MHVLFTGKYYISGCMFDYKLFSVNFMETMGACDFQESAEQPFPPWMSQKQDALFV